MIMFHNKENENVLERLVNCVDALYEFGGKLQRKKTCLHWLMKKKNLVGERFKSKATRYVGFGTTTQNPYVKDTT